LPPFLDSAIPARAAELAHQFATARPFRHVVIDNFLDAGFCQKLIDEFPAFDTRYALNEHGEIGGKAAISDITKLGPAYRQFDALMKDSAFLQLMNQIAGIEALLYDPDYIGGGTHENLAGQELDLHVDFNYHPKTLVHRRLNLIVFLNPEWQAEWGGCLELRENPWDTSAGESSLVIPRANRAVLFETTERSWHGFTRIELPEAKRHLSRRSIAVYFYTEKRPATETVPSHATIYVPRPLPDHLQPGHTLQQEDVDQLQVLIERRNMQIRFLYERETEFSEALSRITNSFSFRLARLLTWPARKLKNL
jgi:Rps23 Pro-64 3,4-dihydroxylase Tpa1-like proline 4-hydroxylase